MPAPKAGDVIKFPAHNAESDQDAQIVEWSQGGADRRGKYYIVRAKNQSQDDTDVLLFIQDRFYRENDDKGQPNADFIGKLKAVQKEGENYVVTVDRRFQYGQKNAAGEGRWLCLHDKANKPYQHRFMTTTVQGRLAKWIGGLGNGSSSDDSIAGIAASIAKGASKFFGDYLRDF